jgi:pimeloyl-ACP methyl ester carboxylesterase
MYTVGRFPRSFGGAGPFLLVIACVVAAHFPAPASAEPFSVGSTTITFVDPSRGGRSIPCDVYYPADAPGSSVPVGGPEGLAYPVVSFGHGYQMTTDKYAFVWGSLVPEGYIVALPRTGGELFPSHIEFGRDMAFVIGALAQAGADPGSIFFGRVASESALMGHSMGGGASFLAAKEYPPVTAVVNFAAAETNPSAIDAASFVTAPTLVFAGSNDCVTPPPSHQIPMYNALASGCRAYINITGASHCQFAEHSVICELGEGGCQPSITRAQQHTVTMQFVELWFGYHLKGDVQAFVAFLDLLSSSPDVTHDEQCDVTGIGPYADGSGRALGRITVSPNPFNPSAIIAFELRRDSVVRLSILDAAGARVRVFASERLPAGTGRFHWDGKTERGEDAPSGVYFYDLQAGAQRVTGKLTLLR